MSAAVTTGRDVTVAADSERVTPITPRIRFYGLEDEPTGTDRARPATDPRRSEAEPLWESAE